MPKGLFKKTNSRFISVLVNTSSVLIPFKHVSYICGKLRGFRIRKKSNFVSLFIINEYQPIRHKQDVTQGQAD